MRHTVFALAGLLAVACATPARATVIYQSNFSANDGGLVAADLGGNPANPWTYGASAGVGGAGAWFVNGSTTISSKALTSPVLTVTADGAVTIAIDHRFNFELNFDGGQLYLSVNAGAFTLVPGTSFTANGYNSTISSFFSSPIAGQEAWSSLSTGYATPAYITSTATLGSFTAGTTLAFRLLGAWDSSVARTNPNWEIGAITVTDASGLAEVPAPPSALLGLIGLGVSGVVRLRRRRA
jgi:hypothetical protein